MKSNYFNENLAWVSSYKESWYIQTFSANNMANITYHMPHGLRNLGVNSVNTHSEEIPLLFTETTILLKVGQVLTYNHLLK